MAEMKVCPLCSDIVEEKTITQFCNAEDFSLLVSECQLMRTSPEVEETNALLQDDASVIKWLLEYASTICINFWDIPDIVKECVKYDKNYMFATLKEYGIYIKYIDHYNHNYGYNCNKNNAIIRAAKFGTPDIITWLVEHGSSVECVDNQYTSCIELAAQYGRLKNMIRLVNCGAQLTSYNSQTILNQAASKGFLHIIKWIFQQREDAHECVTALHNAIETKNYDIVEWLVENNVSVSKSDYSNVTSVHAAAKVGNIICMKWLLEKGAELFVKNTERETVVHIAAHHGHLELIKWLHKEGGNIHERKIYGFTPLHLASAQGHLECAKYLIHCKCEVNVKDRCGKTVLHVAVSSKNLDLIKFLVQHGADIHALDDNRDSVLQFAFCNDYIVSKNFGTNENAIKKEKDKTENCILEILKWLVSVGCDANIRNVQSQTILNKTCLYLFLAISKWLLEIGSDVNDALLESASWFHKCSTEKNWSFLHLCLNYIKDINAVIGGQTLLHFGAQYTEVVKVLLNHKADVNALDDNGNTALHVALNRGSFDAALYLIQHDANINIANKLGETPLYIAAGHSNFDIVNKLISLGASINVKNKYGHCPLRNAILYGKIKIINLLIEAGADVNSLDNKNNSLIISAATSHKWDIVKLLLEKGALLTIGNNNTLVRNATYTKDIALVKWLLEHGASVAHDQSILFCCANLEGDNKLKMMKLLLDYGANINGLNDHGETVLFKIIDDPACVDFLLKNGANVNIQSTERKYSVLHNLIPKNHYFGNHSYDNELRVIYCVLKKLLHAGANVNLKDKKGNTVLHHAVQSDWFIDVAKFLILNGSNINEKNHDGDSVLHLTTSGEIALLLCERGVDINCSNVAGTSVLQSAIENTIGLNLIDLNIVKLLQDRKYNCDKTNSDQIVNSITACRYLRYINFLIKHVKNINETDNRGRSALHYAVKYDMISVFEELVKNGANEFVNQLDGNSILHLAALKKRVEFVKLILDKYGKNESLFAVNKKLETPLQLAVISNSIEVAEMLVHYADVNCKDAEAGESALHIACQHGNIKIVKLLIHHGADIYCKNSKNLSPIQVATTFCRSKILKLFATEVDKNILNLKSDTQETLLHLAVKSGKFNNVPNKIVEYLLMHNIYPIDTVDCKGNSALHYACLTFMVDIVTMLVEHGANINLRNKKNDTPFHNAARTGSIDIINYLLEKGGNPNLKNKRGNTVNHISISHGKINPSKCLLQRGADIFNKNQKGICIIQQTAVSGGTHMFEYLLDNFNKTDLDVTNNRKQTALSLAIKVKCNSHNIESLIEKQKNINHQDICGNTVLHDALRYGSTKYVENIILKGGNVNIKNNQGDTPVHVACRYVEDVSIIQLLMSYFDNFLCVNKLGWNILHSAASGNSIEIVQLLLNFKVESDKTNNGDTILHIACKNKNTSVFCWLIQNCSEIINERNNDGESVLLSCLRLTHIEPPMLDMLLEHGADVHFTNYTGDTALHIAASLARLDFVSYFLHQGVDVNARNHSYNTSLHLSALNGYLDVIKKLVQAACDVNAVNNERQSALHLAAKQGKTSVVKYLVEDVMCDTEILDKNSYSAVQLAELFGHEHVMQWLKSKKL